MTEAGRWSEVAKYLGGAKMLFPDEPLLWRFECRLLIATAEYQAASDLAQTLMEKYPDWPGTVRLASVCSQLADKQP